VVWDSESAEPVQTISCPHSHGIAAMDVSADGLLLVTIGSPSPGTNNQDVSAASARSTSSTWHCRHLRASGSMWHTRSAASTCLCALPSLELQHMPDAQGDTPGPPQRIAPHRTSFGCPMHSCLLLLQIALWDLSCLALPEAQLQLLAATAIPTGDAQTHIAFSPDNSGELVSNGSRRCVALALLGHVQRAALPCSTPHACSWHVRVVGYVLYC
jgi:hypothetical protein